MSFAWKTRLCLRLAGWYKTRKIKTDRWAKMFYRDFQEMPDTVLGFLSEFGNLHVRHPHEHLRWKLDDFRINPFRAGRLFHIDQEGLSDYSEQVGQRLYAIGCASCDRALLLMDPNGQVYAVVDDLVFYIAASGQEAIENMCMGGGWRLIPDQCDH